MASAKMLFAVLLAGAAAFAQSITLPGPIGVQATNASGSSFTYSGTLTQAATIALNVSGTSCEQGGGVYCTNAAGVIVIAGSSGVGATTTFTGPVGGFSGTWNYGSLIMTISGVGSVQVFPANVANGLGSSTPPVSLSRSSTSLSALGFANFSVVNPTITFTNADSLYTDNSGGFTVTQTGLTATPAPSTLVLVLLGLAALTLGLWYKTVRDNGATNRRGAA